MTPGCDGCRRGRMTCGGSGSRPLAGDPGPAQRPGVRAAGAPTRLGQNARGVVELLVWTAAQREHHAAEVRRMAAAAGVLQEAS